MAYDLQKLTPTHMLHAGRYSALGQDVERGGTLLPESQVRGKVWREWLPDIYLNPHGYPSHEWVQQFAGYVPPGFRTYWSTRGWYTNLSGVRDPREPDLIHATEALREAIVREINGNPDVRAMNMRQPGALSQMGVRLQPERLRTGDLQGHGDLLHRSGNGRSRAATADARRRRRARGAAAAR